MASSSRILTRSSLPPRTAWAACFRVPVHAKGGGNQQTLNGSFLAASKPNLQENIRVKALDEIYKIYILLHRACINTSAIILPTFCMFSKQFFSDNYFGILCFILTNFCRNFAAKLAWSFRSSPFNKSRGKKCIRENAARRQNSKEIVKHLNFLYELDLNLVLI